MNTYINRMLTTALCVLLFTTAAFAHDVYLPVIIDTDGAADDIRAIALLLNAGGADIRLIVTSDGVLDPEQAKTSVNRLLACLGRTDIPVAAGTALSAPPPVFRKLNLSLNWPECGLRAPAGVPSGKPAATAIVDAVNGSDQRFLYLCLGPMTNLASAFKAAPEIKNKLYRVVFLGNAPDSDAPGWNTLRDTTAAQTVYAAGVPVFGLGLPDDQYIRFDDLYRTIAGTDSDTARLLTTIHDFPAMREKIANHHIRVWDEMVSVYLNRVSAFDFKAIPGRADCYRLVSYDAPAVREAYARLLGNPADFHIDSRKSVVLKKFPMDASMMRPDVAPLVESIITAHGTEEWKACLLTNELHRHLGIYSLVGAKMGIRAREILEAPFDTLTVVSHAGSKPPLSCMNDGLQVSTGASLGRGTITVEKEAVAPAAEFVKGDIRLTLTLKPEYVTRIRADIKAAINRFGGLGPEYFAHIRTLSIQYWKDFDRNDLFEETFSR